MDDAKKSKSKIAPPPPSSGRLSLPSSVPNEKPGPPPKPKSPEGLAEVERALSVLQGRHPEHERLQREDAENRKKRQAEIDAKVRTESRRAILKHAKLASIATAVAVVVIFIFVIVRGELNRRSRIERAGEPFQKLGFTLVETSSRGSPTKAEASVPAGCVVATSTVPDARLRITHAGGAIEGAAPVIGCLCEGGHVAVEATTMNKPEGEGVVLLRAEAAAVGGSRAFAFLPFKPGTSASSDQACAEASLDAWLEAKRWAQVTPYEGAPRPTAPVDEAGSESWLKADPKRAALKPFGFKVTALVKREAPFAVVEIPAESCVLLLDDEANDNDKISVRFKAGAPGIPPTTGNVGWCTATEAIVVIQREVSSAGAAAVAGIAVALTKAANVGGLHGMREIVDAAGLKLTTTWLPASDHGWSSKLYLMSSAIPESLITIANVPSITSSDTDSRIVAVSGDKPNALQAETPPDVFSFCDPQLDRNTSALCIFSGPQKWRVDGDASAGLARAKLPFWLFALQGVGEPVALKAEIQLLTLSRRLKREGFEPTTIEAVTELDKGAEVLGRSGEDAMVAIGLAPAAPWVFPYTDGAAWSLESGEEPRVIPIAGMQRISVTAVTKAPLPPKATRRTVVFRRQKR